MQIFQSYDSNCFKFNGTKYVKNFLIIKQGNTNISVHNAFDVKFQLLGSTHFSEVSVNGSTYSNQSDLMSALSTLLFSKQIVDIDGLNSVLSGITDTYTIGGTYSTGTLSFERNDGSVYEISGFSDSQDLQSITDLGASTTNIINVGGLDITDRLSINTSLILSPRNALFQDKDGTVAYLDDITSLLEGIAWKQPVELNLTSGVDDISPAIIGITSLTQQGVTLVNGSRVMVSGMSNQTKNGIYRVSATLVSGVGGYSYYRLFRTNDANTTSKLNQMIVSVVGGTNSGKTYRQITQNPIIGTSSIFFIDNDIFTTGGTYSNGTLILNSNNGSSFAISGFSTGGTSTLNQIPYSGATNNVDLGLNTIIANNLSGINSGDNAINITSNAYTDSKITQTILSANTGTTASEAALFNALNSKANTSNVVLLTGNQTIDGVKTFNSEIIVNNGVRIGLGNALGTNLVVGNAFGSGLNAASSGNIAIGSNALLSIGNTTAVSNNIAIGNLALNVGSQMTNNVAIGTGALRRIAFASHSNNVAVGFSSGELTNTGGLANAINQCTLIGSQTTTLNNSDTNSIVIGFQGRGNGSNTVTLGNTSIIDTFLRGRVNIQQYTTATRPIYVKGAVIFDSTLNKLVVGGATAWEVISST